MILYRVPLYLAIMLCLFIIYGLFTVKDNVMTLKFELQEVKKQVQNEEDTIRIIKAEMAYLGSPERIQKLAEQYLNLAKPTVAQIIKDPVLDSQTNIHQLVSSKIIKRANKWRYKQAPHKHLIMAKGRK